MNDPVPELIQLLVKPVVFIKWPKGVKGTKRRWKHLTVADMKPRYLANLQHGNIGVALGEVSAGLCAIDFDESKYVEPFLALNPFLSGTLQTHGARGQVFWLRFNSDYPKKTTKLKTHAGGDVGEFRSNGSQSIIWGLHPDTQKAYQFVVRQSAVAVDFTSLRWPDEIANKPTLANYTEEQKHQKIQKPRGTEELKSCACVAPSSFYCAICTIEDAVRVALPNKKRENNACLFKLARAIKTLEVKGQIFDLPKLESVFNQWHTEAHEFLREGQTKEDYYLEFMNACQRAKFPLGGAKVATAFEQAKTQPFPAESMRFENPDMRLLIAFLKQMQAMQGAEPFFITVRDCAALLGHKTHATAQTWLGALTKLKFIRVAQPGNTRQATRYFYVWVDNGNEK